MRAFRRAEDGGPTYTWVSVARNLRHTGKNWLYGMRDLGSGGIGEECKGNKSKG